MVSGSHPIIRNGLTIHVNLKAEEKEHIGYRARRYANPLDIEGSQYDLTDYWEPILPKGEEKDKEPSLVLDPNEFYILASKETITIPPEYAAEMIAIDPMMGEFRAHYAAFLLWDLVARTVEARQSLKFAVTMYHFC